MAEDTRVEKRRGAWSPLGVISLFLSFSEVMLGLAVTKTQGWIQVALTSFVIGFPLAICVAFFVILWKKPYVFYPPTEFGPNVDVAAYVQHMGSGPTPKPLAESISKKLEVDLSPQKLKSEIERILIASPEKDHIQSVANFADLLRKQVQASVRETLVRIDSTPLLGSRGHVWDEPYDPEMATGKFLDQIWRQIQPNVAPYSYGQQWVLKDRDTGRVFGDLGRNWARKQGVSRDFRPLADVGITPRTILEVMKP
jgi:hypothetical protein